MERPPPSPRPPFPLPPPPPLPFPERRPLPPVPLPIVSGDKFVQFNDESLHDATRVVLLTFALGSVVTSLTLTLTLPTFAVTTFVSSFSSFKLTFLSLTNRFSCPRLEVFVVLLLFFELSHRIRNLTRARLIKKQRVIKVILFEKLF